MKKDPLTKRLYMMVRKDIGRKAMALGLALILWVYLDDRIVTHDYRTLKVLVVEGAEGFEQASLSQENAFFVVLPSKVMLRESQIKPSATLNVTLSGPKDIIPPKLIGRVDINESQMEEEDERILPIRIKRDHFDSLKGRERIGITQNFSPTEIRIRVAKKDSFRLRLGGNNLVFDKRNLNAEPEDPRFSPTDITIEGPVAEIDRIRANPEEFKFEPIPLYSTESIEVQLTLSSQLVNERKISIKGNKAVSVEVDFQEMSGTLPMNDCHVMVRYNGHFLTPEQRSTVEADTVNIILKGPITQIIALKEAATDELLKQWIWPYIDLVNKVPDQPFDLFSVDADVIKVEIQVPRVFHERYPGVKVTLDKDSTSINVKKEKDGNK